MISGGGFQDEINVYRVERKLEPFFYPIDQSCLQKGVDIGVDALDIATNTSRDFAKRNGTCTCHCLQDGPSIGSKHAP